MVFVAIRFAHGCWIILKIISVSSKICLTCICIHIHYYCNRGVGIKNKIKKQIIQQKIELFSNLNHSNPHSGWIKAIRGSLGITIRQLAIRVGVGHGSINQLEKREPLKKVTLESLQSAAQAMDCKLIYAIVPNKIKGTLADIIEQRANLAAVKILNAVNHSMRLEAQGTSKKELQEQIQRIANELKENGDSRIWQEDIVLKKPKQAK